MTALAFDRAARAQSALNLSRDLLAGLNEESIEDRGSFYVIGQLEETLREASRVIEELIAELAGRAA